MESLEVFNLAARGDPTGPQLDRRTGEGYVAAHAGDYCSLYAPTRSRS